MVMEGSSQDFKLYKYIDRSKLSLKVPRGIDGTSKVQKGPYGSRTVNKG